MKPILTCRWTTTCNDYATNIIIYACENQHILEHALCNLHTSAWMTQTDRQRTYCPEDGKKIENYYYDIVPIREATVHYIQEYIHNTYQPHSREPYQSC
jgi:hypothetical protein